MKILICAEFFYPSVGGVQEVVKQISLRLVSRGHDVTVVTSALKERNAKEYYGIKIQSFDVSGNLVNGIYGDVDEYRDYVIHGDFDLIFIYAAQQWTFDALINYFQEIKAKKIFVPCGFSQLHNPAYEQYFSCMVSYLALFDALIFHSRGYRDFAFAKRAGVKKLFVIPNGADNREFLERADGDFRSRFSIPEENIILLTVGSLNGAKGHLELAEAFSLINLNAPLTLILNGSPMPAPKSKLILRIVRILKKLEVSELRLLVKRFLIEVMTALRIRDSYISKMKKMIANVNAGQFGENKKIFQVNFDRKDLVNCFFSSNLFVLASKIEYSPLVLFESCAAGLPFLTVPVGNAREIVDWTGGGEICDAHLDESGYTVVDPARLALRIEEMLCDSEKLKKLSLSGRSAWESEYNWDCIADKYERIFLDVLDSKE